MSNAVRLFKGERLASRDKREALALHVSDEKINQKYAMGEVRIVTEQARYPLSSIVALLESGDYKLDPDFQRRHRWAVEKKSRLIESLIMNVPIPPIFLYEDRYSHYEVMDGLQRLTAIGEFYTDKFALAGLAEWPELNGRAYSQLPDQIRKGIDRRYISSIILLQETAKSAREAMRLKQMVFERINSGGIQLEPQESRNAIYDGPLNRLCINLASNRDFRALWGIPQPGDVIDDGGEVGVARLSEIHQKMTDVELVLRFFAYRQRENLHQGAFKDYLDFYLREGNAFSADLLASLSTLFTSTIGLASSLFGENAFKLFRSRKGGKWVWFDRPTTVVYDPLMFALSAVVEQGPKLIQKKNEIGRGLESFYKVNATEFEGRYTNKSNLKARNELFVKYLSSFL